MIDKFVIIIPARYHSRRFPGKAIADILGVPMIVRTYRQCIKAIDSEFIYIATDDDKIKGVCKRYGISNVIMTSSSCQTGTDRVAEAARKIEADIYINLQGDEPVFDPGDIVKFLEAVDKYRGEVLNGYCPIYDEELFRSVTIPKVVFSESKKLLYMSRSAIPTNQAFDYVKGWRQICIYSYPAAALKMFASYGKTPLEKIEDIEILRFLDLGWSVRMVELSGNSISVDVPNDVRKVEDAITERC